jgi:hypothetical protein
MLALLQASTPALPIDAVGTVVLVLGVLLTLGWVAALYR